ncbi:hypothetical protein PG993_005784 [Apiospora rasikravindrae]|uniref:Uncharacterized protein n=1 Tax=Apiospora rasikravindrae TaxID=990691 RepID=A0ABR1TC49_9PEZI
MASSSNTRRVTQITAVNSVFKACWHIDPTATPKQRQRTLTLRPNEPDPDWTFRIVSEPALDGTCPRCTRILADSRRETSNALTNLWLPRLEFELQESFETFEKIEQDFLSQFVQACRDAVLLDQNPYHQAPLLIHTRQLRQMVLFGNELLREVIASNKPHPQVVQATILVLGKVFLQADIWSFKNDGELRDGFEIAVPEIMTTVLAMRPNENLEADIGQVMEKEFGKADIF